MENVIKKQENNLVVGRKDFLSYMRHIKFLFKRKDRKNIFLIARGQNIVKAFDLAEATKNRFLDELGISYGKIEPITETFEKEGKNHFVTAIKIELLKKY